jgi:hypothetical protein
VVRVYRYVAQNRVNAIPKRYLDRITENQRKNRPLIPERLVTNVYYLLHESQHLDAAQYWFAVIQMI